MQPGARLKTFPAPEVLTWRLIRCYWVNEDDADPVFRLYDWECPTLSLGKMRK
ncbi:MAG: hypothetical protein Ct9H300mP28_31420 [Pseudomonadota bacterium]|nr:MAG: hypothetical protein Ct9H300mP28_31420 [Pseudomonadota bacterium]